MNAAPGQANIRQLPVAQSSKLTRGFAGTMPLAKARKNDRKKHDATSMMAGASAKAPRTRSEEKGHQMRWPSLGRTTHHGEAAMEDGSSTAHLLQGKP
jgi:hypothetical protein